MVDATPLSFLGRMLERMQASVDGLRADNATLRASVNAYDQRFIAVEGRLNEMAMRQGSLEVGLMRVAERLEKFEALMDVRVTGLERRLEGFEGRLEGVETGLGRLEERVGAVEGKLDLILQLLRR